MIGQGVCVGQSTTGQGVGDGHLSHGGGVEHGSMSGQVVGVGQSTIGQGVCVGHSSHGSGGGQARVGHSCGVVVCVGHGLQVDSVTNGVDLCVVVSGSVSSVLGRGVRQWSPVYPNQHLHLKPPEDRLLQLPLPQNASAQAFDRSQNDVILSASRSDAIISFPPMSIARNSWWN